MLNVDLTRTGQVGGDADANGRAIDVSTMAAVMAERVPMLQVDLDEWTVRMMRWHFSSETGSPFWLDRRDTLGFDPLRDVRDFDSLRLFGLFDKDDLRGARVRDMLPIGLAGRPFRVVETGGTTGAPCRVVDVSRARYDVEIFRTMLAARSLYGVDVVAMAPSGPHAYGHFVSRLVDTWRGAACFVDFDPRWVKAELRAKGSADGYVAHLIDQTRRLLEAERPQLLFTTSRLLLALVAELPEPLAAYGLRAVCTGGTSTTAEEAGHLQAEHLDGVQWIDTYGNTLMGGHGLQADPLEPGRPHSYHLPGPLAVMRAVHPDRPLDEVAVGERGRVLVVTLLEDLFVPNLLERDTARRVGPHPWFDWEGLAEVRPFVDEQEVMEGVY